MAIGTSKGAFHEDEFRHEAAPWFLDAQDELNNVQMDNNIIDPDLDTGPKNTISDPIIKVSDQSDAEAFNSLPDNQYMKNIDKSPGFFLSEEMQQQPWKKYSDRAKSLTQQTYEHYKKGDPDITKSVRDWESKTLTAGYNDTEAGVALKAEALNNYGSKTTMSKNAIWETYMQHLQDLAAADAEDEKHSPEMKQNLENFSLFDRVGRTQIDLKPMWAKGKYK